METLPGPLGSQPKRVAGKGGTNSVGGVKGWDSVLATGRASLPIAAREEGGAGAGGWWGGVAWRLGTRTDLTV